MTTTGFRIRSASPVPVTLLLQPEGCIAEDRGIVLGIQRAAILGRRITDIREAFERAAASARTALVSVSVFRLSPEFPIDVENAGELAELAALLRALDRLFVANVSVLEFGGIRAAAARMLSRAVVELVRPRAAIADFHRLSDAVAWLRPHAQIAGAPTDPATYVRLYREVDRQLDELDASRGRIPRSAGA